MSRNLFFAIGMHDLQAVYKVQNDLLRRSSRGLSNIRKEQITLPIMNGKEIWELDRTTNKPDKPIGLCFPIFDKVMSYIIDKGIKNVDRLFILSTDRSEILPVLKKIKDEAEKDLENLPDYYDYLERGLIRWIKGDPTTEIAKILKECIEQGKMQLGSVTIKNVEILKLGTYGVLKPILDLDTSKTIKSETLELADINTLSFFEKEIYEAIAPYLRFLENSNVLLGTHAGGMPLTHRALDNVLDNCIGYARKDRIFVSEYLPSYRETKKSEQEFLRTIGQMNQSVVNMEWDQALLYLDRVKDDLPSFWDYKTQEKIFTKAKALWETKGDWYERFTAHIFRALYTDSFNELVVWISSMEQAAKQHLAHKQIGELWKTVDRGGYSVEFSEPIKNKSDCKLDMFILLGYINRNKLEAAFEDYIDVFINRDGSLEKDQDWYMIYKLRNDLVHSGIAPATRNKNKDLVYRFLGIDQKDLEEVRSSIRSRDLQKIIAFERNCLSNKFFAPLGRIVGFNKDILRERLCSKEYFESLHIRSDGV